MNKAESLNYMIDTTLENPQCSVISPGLRYKKVDFSMPERVVWNTDNLTKLKEAISKRMKTLFRMNSEENMETVEIQPPVLYIDCEEKGDDDILLHLFNESMKRTTVDNKRLQDYEGSESFDGLAALMDNQRTRQLYLYLDNVETLTIDEQRKINRLLYSRGGIQYDKYVYLKINNGKNGRKSRMSDSGRRIESTHDFSEKYIYEEDL